MDLKIEDVADLLNVPESTVKTWITEGKIPSYTLNNQYRFSRMEFEEWVMKQKNQQMKDLKVNESSKPGREQFSLFRALHKGDLLQEIKGEDKKEVISNGSKLIAQNLNLDPEVLSDLLLDREKLAPTAINKGIAIPHTRELLLSNMHDKLFIAFPENPIDYGALDGNPVHTLFFLFASEDKKHLQLLAKIAHLSSDENALHFLSTKPSRETLLQFIKEWETNIPIKSTSL